jgi:hypothetical protein
MVAPGRGSTWRTLEPMTIKDIKVVETIKEGKTARSAGP